jgi:hypothetical protein
MKGSGPSGSPFQANWSAKDEIGVGAERKNLPVHHVTMFDRGSSMSVAACIRPGSLLLLALLGCDGGPSGPSTGGSLRVTILGLPTGSAATVTVTGPGGFNQGLTSTQTLSQLAPGTYAVTATDVTIGGAQYSPSPSTQSVTVNSNQSTATVVYGGSTGSLTVNITGLGTSRTAAVTVTGPAGYSQPVNSSTTLKALTPGDYTVSAANPASAGCTNNTPTPTAQIVTVVAKQTAVANVSYNPAAGSGSVNLCIAAMYLIQSAQNLSGSVPLVEGRDAYLRVFAVADQANTPAPVVQLRIFQSGVPVDTRVINPTRATVPTAADESALSNSWNYLVPASSIQQGVSIEATVDPLNAVAESNDSDNVLVLSPTDIRAVPTLNVTMVPILQTATGKLGDVTNANKSAFLDVARSMHPLDSVNIQVRSTPLSTSTTLQSDGTGWLEVLDQVDAASVADGRYYYGVAKVSYQSGVAGIAFVSEPSLASHAAMGWDAMPSAAVVVAHELAHNWGRKHAPCGSPTDLDANYPDPSGLTDSYGLDLSTAQPTLKPATFSDIMGYCSSKWASEYTYRGVFDYLAPLSSLPVSAGVADQPAQPSLLVWGHLGDDGLVLEPAFHITARPRLPSASGPYWIEGRSTDGSVLFARSFQPAQVADLPGNHRSFAFAIPLSEIQAGRLASIRLSGEGRATEVSASPAPLLQVPAGTDAVEVRRQIGGRVALRWDHRAYPMVMVRDPDTGEVLSFARGGEVQLLTGKSKVDLLLSNGVGSSRRRVSVAP